MKKLVAWTEEPVLVASVANGEMSGGVEMEHEMLHAEEVEKDEPDSVPVKRPSKKELDREEGRRGNERKPSNRVTYYDVPGAPDSTPRVAYRPSVARGSYRPTGVLGYVNPEKEARSQETRAVSRVQGTPTPMKSVGKGRIPEMASVLKRLRGRS